MFEDLAQSATAVFLFALAGFGLTWLLSPLTTSWELVRLRLSPRSIDDRLSGQSLVGPVIILGAIGFVVSGIVGWSVGMLMQDFDPIRFAESARHINVTLVALAIFAVAAYLANAYARFGAGKPVNPGERLHELQHQERGFYAAGHMDARRWAALRQSTTAPWEHLRPVDQALLARLLGSPLPNEPWNHIKQEIVHSWRSTHPEDRDHKEDHALARQLWKYHPAHLIRMGTLAVLASGVMVLSIDSGDTTVILTALGSVGFAFLAVPPLVLRATRSANRARTAVLARDLLWTRQSLGLIDVHLAELSSPSGSGSTDSPTWNQLLLMMNEKVRREAGNA